MSPSGDVLTPSPAGVEAFPEIFLGEDWEKAVIFKLTSFFLVITG